MHTYSQLVLSAVVHASIAQQNTNVILRSRGGRRGQNDEKKNKFFLTKEMTRKPRKPSRSKSDEKEEVLVVVDASPLLLKKTSIDKPESVGVLSNDNKESITSVDDPQDQTVLVSSMSQDVEDTRQAQAQGRRLLDEATFLARCESTSGLTGSNAYVDCVSGVVNGTSTSCADACIVNGVSKCCTGYLSCDPYIYNGQTSGGFTGKVCKDGSCSSGGGGGACYGGTIPYVIGPSCTGDGSCSSAQIGSVDSSCNDNASCLRAQLSGVDLINSCNAYKGCYRTSRDGAFDELIDCCNDNNQCKDKDELDIVAAGCSTSDQPTTQEPTSDQPTTQEPTSNQPTSAQPTSAQPTSDQPTTQEPSISQEPSEVPSAVPSESGKPSLVPSFVPSQSSAPSDEPSGLPSQSLEPSVESSATPSTSVMPSSSPIVSDTKSAKKRPWKAKAKGGKKTNPW